MSTDIPTTPCEDPAETIMAAIAHGMEGNPALGLSLLSPFLKDGPTPTVSMCASLASMVAVAVEKQNPGAPKGSYGLLALHHGLPANAQEMPPGLRFAAQFTTAWLNGEGKTAYALFNALLGEGTDQDASNLVDGVLALYSLAVTSAQQMRATA
ncbi:hypothetical protein [Streptomyces cinereoruber]|uniref:hypothetical protein n=1 Tax=Streptomyces cinereoruber TaxID=67260 RepID=UPI0036440C06